MVVFNGNSLIQAIGLVWILSGNQNLVFFPLSFLGLTFGYKNQLIDYGFVFVLLKFKDNRKIE
jgi:hypothetical protein